MQEVHERRLEVTGVTADRPLELGRRAGEQELAVGEQEHAARVALDFGDVVGREHDRRPALGERRDELPQALALPGIERCGWLVEQQHGWLGDQPDGDVDALLVAARELCDLLVAALAQSGQLEHPTDDRFGIGRVLEPREQPQVLGHRQLRVERRLLRHPAGLVSGPAELALVGLEHAGQNRQQRRLAGTVGPDDSDQLTRPAARS